MRKVLLVFIVWFLLVNVVNKVSFQFLTDYTSYELPKHYTIQNRFWIVPWLNFDGRNYLKIATDGYNSTQKFNIRVFFPFYPLLIRIFSFNLFFNPIVVGLLISLFSIILGVYTFNKLLILEKIAEVDKAKILSLLFLFPTSFFYLSYYTESLLLLLTLLTFFFLKEKKFVLASIFAALASGTKVLGLALFPVILWEAYRSYKTTKRVSVSMLIAPLGFIFYSLYNYFVERNLFLALQGHSDWGRHIGILSPLQAFIESFSKVLFGSEISQHNIFIRSIEVLEFVSAVFLILMLILGYRRLKFSYWLYLLCSALVLFFSGSLGSLPRHLLLLFPIHIVLVKLLPTKLYYMVGTLFFILLIYLTALFLRGYWVA